MTDIEERALSSALRDVVAEPVLPFRLADRVATRHARRRRRRVVAGATCAGLAAVAIAYGPFGGPRVALQPAGPSHPGWLGATGVVVAKPGRPVRFCQSLAGDTSSCADKGVVVVGVNLSKLDSRDHDGTRYGSRYLAGTYAGGVLTVRQQGKPRYPSRLSTYDQVTCVAPAGGWPSAPGAGPTGSRGTAEAYSRTHPNAIARSTSAGTYARWPKLVLTAYDAPRTAKDLGVVRGGDVCVVQSRYTKAQLAKARADAERAYPDRPSLGNVVFPPVYFHHEDAQSHYWIHVEVETAKDRAFVERYPKGLLVIDSWLRPV